MKKLLFIPCLLAITFAIQAQNEAMTNQTVLDLLKEGFTSEVIIGTIETSTERTITCDINYMRELKAAGADANLITYIQKIAKTDFGYEGIMWWNTGDKPKKLYRTQFERDSKSLNLKTGAAMLAGGLVVGATVGGRMPSGVGAGSATAGTIGLMSTSKDVKKLMLPGTTARVVLTGENGRNPVFRFYFPKTESNSFETFETTADFWYSRVMNSIETPNEFQLIKMQVKQPKKKGQGGFRTFPDEMSYTVMGFESSGAGNRTVINFEIKDINNSTFEVTFPNGLEPGEYCFFYKSGLKNEFFKEQPFGFDFSVQ